MELKEENQKRKVIVTSSISILGLLLIVGISYAFWQITKYQEDQNVITSGCFDIKLEGGKAINLENAYPIEDTEGAKLTPYTFTITNICDLLASYTVNLEMLEGTTMASKYIKVMMNKEEIKNLGSLEQTEPVLKNSVESRKIISGSLGARDSEEYSLRIWMDGEITIEEKEAMNKQMLSKVVVKAEPKKYSPVESGITLLKDAILATEYQTTDIEEAKEKIARKQEVDFSKTAPIIDWEEAHASSTSTYTATLPDPSLVNSGIAGTEDLTDTNILPIIGTGYTFNSETGKYSLTGIVRIDPTSVNLTEKDYYIYLTETIKENGKLKVHTGVSDVVRVQKIKSASKDKCKLKFEGELEYDALCYKFTVYKYEQTAIESDKSDKGLYQINDDYGTSYYYRGSVLNNNVYFAGYYWKILRINGDGSIRLLYLGNNSNSTKEESTIGNYQFNNLKNNPAYVGYMYGNTLNSSYELTHANEVDSNIKIVLDNWYLENIENTDFSKYIADSGFCNDRSLASGDGYSNLRESVFNAGVRSRNHQPSLSCSRNDLFTTSSNSLGNGNLTYPIGTITNDELLISGSLHEKINSLNFTYSKSNYMTMTPFSYLVEPYFAHISINEYTGKQSHYTTTSVVGIRPVINLKADTEISGGIGTNNNPYIIK